MIHAFALEPELVATWGKREEFRFIHDKFGFGTPRVLLELPAFKKWKKAVYDAATELEVSQEDMKRVEELFRLFGEHRYRRADAAPGETETDGAWHERTPPDAWLYPAFCRLPISQ